MKSKQHAYWGAVEAGWAGFSGQKKITLPGFEKEAEIFPGDVYDEDGEEIKNPPTPYILDLYEQTFRQCVALKTFGRYLRVAFVALTVLLLTAYTAMSQTSTGQIPLIAVPYYNYSPLKITIGKYRNKLLTKDPAVLLTLAGKIRKDIDRTDVESIYFLAVRLYDLGKKDDAFYWFYTANIRARIFIKTLNPAKEGSIGAPAFERHQLFNAISKIAGEYINGHEFGDMDKALAALQKVHDEIPALKSMSVAYPGISFLGPTVLQSEKDAVMASLAQTIISLRASKADIKKQRAKNGIEGKY